MCKGQLAGKVIIVTGGTRGIGFATCRDLASRGAIVYAGARHPFKTEDIQDHISYHQLDVTDFSSCEVLAKDVFEKHGHIDGLVADAGITADALTSKMSEDMFDRVVNTNLKGVFNIVKATGSYMDTQAYGSIVAISSIVGEFGNIGQANYAATKAGVIGMVKSWAKEYARKGKPIRVNAVAPGYILTDMLKTVPQNLLEKFEQTTMLKRLGKPEEVAKVISFLLSVDASYITGAVIDVNGGMRL